MIFHMFCSNLLKKVIPDFQRLTQFMRNPMIARTTSSNENHYRQTDPKQIKKIYKTTTGIPSYLSPKMEYNTQKNTEKYPTPNNFTDPKNGNI